ncbi:septation ring formation regulator EzrA [Halobacillus sp. A1]|uniref:septation ring formation regulator EzrA n=1 Tax=Halobacillus sp. A1 TaxID=2880262 RepID=UPI0020A6B332|nr:septation ring formation regulator EzrA [Halobacillus sp. A1]MCP3033523.1 septation ring formation regulator EzrA [Halobacillus sp. A1]
MSYVIGGIIILIALIIVGLIWRKKIYDEVDRLEGWKMDIMHRNVSEELSRVKALNLSGETQDRFESWRTRWEQILTKELPDLEEDLFDAEESADRYRLTRVKKVLNHTEQKLQAIERDITNMYEELEVLLDSEKSSRQEIQALEPELKELKRTIIHSRHQYGKAAALFEARIIDLENKLSEYEELVSEGNYIEASDLVQSIRETLETLKVEIELFPERFKKTSKELPDQLSDLLNGIKEMDEEGYRVNQLDFLPEIENYQEQLKNHSNRMEKGDQEDVQQLIDEVEPRIQEMYQSLEREAIAHSYVDQQHPSLTTLLEELEEVMEETNKEIEELQMTYQMEDEDVETHRNIVQMMTQLKKKYLSLNKALEDEQTPRIQLKGELDIMKEELEELKANHHNFNERVQTLRRDEIEAKAKLSEMEQLINDTDRRLKRSNLPGIPTLFFEGMQAASEHIEEVFVSLEKQPLDMHEVHEKLEKAVHHTVHVNKQAKELLHQAEMAESMIQYGNRYRSKYPLIAARLMEAENDFRSYRYEEALERAASAVEEVDPGALSRIEEKREVPV